VLIDSTHKRWFWVTLLLAAAAVAVYLALASRAPGGLTGGSTTGLWYGVLGAGLMVYAGLLAAHRHLPRRQWLGARQTWLRGHIWLGLLSAVFLLCHSGFRWGRGLEVWLWVAVIGTLVTGIVGLFLQQVVPRLMTERVVSEAPYEQIPHLCQLLRRRADELVDGVCGPHDPAAPKDTWHPLRRFHEEDVRPFLASRVPRGALLLHPLQAEARFGKLRRLAGLEPHGAQLDELARICDERRQMAEQEGWHRLLHLWLLVHLPFSAAVLILGAAHVFWSLYY
jgi:hypothetical protein